MTDRELLEAAAKAAGYVVESMRSDGGAWCYPVGEQPDEHGDHPGLFAWNPRENDGDALRLAVKLRLHVDHHRSGVTAWVMPWASNDDDVHCFEEDTGDDPYAATRLAIFRAAAAIGGAKP